MSDQASRPGEYRIPDQARDAQCQSCGALIVWTRTSKNGRPIPLSMKTVRTDAFGARYALNHFSDCPNARQHRKPAQAAVAKSEASARAMASPSMVDLRDLHEYLVQRGLIVIGSTIIEPGDGRLLVELQTSRES